MKKKFEIADIISQFLPQLKKSLPLHHHKTLRAIEACRTAALGGHIDECNACGHLKISYNSCRNRHCPKCQGINKEMWIIQQEEMLLPVAYFHVVFTLPHELNELCLYNPKQMYDLLFQAAWHTLNSFAKDTKWLGATTAATMVLHTWSQKLILHPHVHCIVPNGGLTKEDNWQFPKKGNGNFLFPVPAMKKVHRGYFLEKLKKLILQGTLRLPPNFPIGYKYQLWKNILYQKDWVVFTKKPFSGVKHVVDYLARYSHRVAITNRRIKNISQDTVIFEYKDYKDKAKKKLLSLKGPEFLRRFCLHILPKGYRKVRQFGFTSNASKGKAIAKARLALGLKARQLSTRSQRKQLALKRLFDTDIDQCPCCQKGKLVPIYGWAQARAPPSFDRATIKTTANP